MRSIKPYTKDRTKMTITTDDLMNNLVMRMKLAAIARSMDHYITCYGAVPSFPDNDDQRKSYLDSIMEQCKAMEEVLNNG